MTIQSQLLGQIPGIIHGFGTLAEPIPKSFESQWEKRPQKKQVHGIDCVEVIQDSQGCGEVDALFARRPGLMVPVISADCVPVLMARKDGRAVAAYHAGWRGTLAGLAQELWKKLQSLGEDSKDWVAAIGPAIGPCCYETSSEIATRFLQKFADYGPQIVQPRTRHIHLSAINAAELKSLGLAAVETISICTRCTALNGDPKTPLMHSYRREGPGHFQWSVAMTRKDLRE